MRRTLALQLFGLHLLPFAQLGQLLLGLLDLSRQGVELLHAMLEPVFVNCLSSLLFHGLRAPR